MRAHGIVRVWRVATFWPRMAWKLFRAPVACRDAVASAILCLHTNDFDYDCPDWKLTLYFSNGKFEGAQGELSKPWPPRNPPTTTTVTGSDGLTILWATGAT